MMQFVMSQDKTSITPPEAGLQRLFNLCYNRCSITFSGKFEWLKNTKKDFLMYHCHCMCYEQTAMMTASPKYSYLVVSET